jgi:HEAT repeat protein
VLTPGDLYIEGDFTGSRTPGWRRLDATASDLAAELDSPERRAADRALYASILDAEKGQGDLAPEDLIAVLSDDDPRLVARAAYALGVLHVAAAIPTLGQLVVEHDDLDVRLRAIEALASFDDARTVRPAIAALDDPEERIRAIAARHLGGLAAQARPAKDALLAVVTTETPADQTGTDRVAALLALADLGDPQVLVAAALSVTAKDGPLEQALAWAFQELSPKLGKKEEATTLVTVLDHPSDMVRRYALQRLAELAVPSTATALERRLAAEDAELLPLVEVALSSVRIERDGGDALGIDDRARIAWERVQQFWRERDETERTAILGGAGGFALLVLVFSILGRRRRRAREAEEWASMVAPSDEVYDDEYAEYDEYAEEGYEGEYEDDGGEYADGEYEEEWSEDEAYADEVRR